MYFSQCLLGSRSQVAAVHENDPQAGKLCWTWASPAGRPFGEPCAEPRHQMMQRFRHKVTWRQMLSWAKALISSQLPRYLWGKCVHRWLCFGMAGTALQGLSCLCVPCTLTYLCHPVSSEFLWGSLLSSSSTPDNTGLTKIVGLTQPKS